MELPAYESARKTGLPAYNESAFEDVQLEHRQPTPSSPPPSLGPAVDEATPPTHPVSSPPPALDTPRPDRPLSIEQDPFADTTRAASRAL